MNILLILYFSSTFCRCQSRQQPQTLIPTFHLSGIIIVGSNSLFAVRKLLQPERWHGKRGGLWCSSLRFFFPQRLHLFVVSCPMTKNYFLMYFVQLELFLETVTSARLEAECVLIFEFNAHLVSGFSKLIAINTISMGTSSLGFDFCICKDVENKSLYLIMLL